MIEFTRIPFQSSSSRWPQDANIVLFFKSCGTKFFGKYMVTGYLPGNFFDGNIFYRAYLLWQLQTLCKVFEQKVQE